MVSQKNNVKNIQLNTVVVTKQVPSWRNFLAEDYAEFKTVSELTTIKVNLFDNDNSYIFVICDKHFLVNTKKKVIAKLKKNVRCIGRYKDLIFLNWTSTTINSRG